MQNSQSLIQILREKCGLEITNLQVATESMDYEACSFLLNHFYIQYRASKITPTKIGQFVTLWKRNEQGITAPFHIDDNLDFAIIKVQKEQEVGHFVFPKSILLQKGILSDNQKDGKRGFRIYPPWDIVENKQAKQTQEWQLNYFLPISNEDFRSLLV